ncbi:MAG: DUF5666 domain-containing protein, partial [Chloroflexota bacterium]
MNLKSLSKPVLLMAIAILLFSVMAACTPQSSGEPAGGQEDAEPLETVVISGEVRSISAKTWNVAGRELVVSQETKIEKDIQVGDIVEVHGRDGDDGLTLATAISLDRSGLDDEFNVDNADDDMNDNDDDDNMNDNDGDDDMNDNDDDDNMNDNDDDDDMNDNDDDDNMNGNDGDDDMNDNDDDDDMNDN